MYAILQQSGHQYRVSPGDRLVVDRLTAEVGSVVALEPVVLVAGDDGTQIGTPVVSGARIAAVVVSHRKGAKLRVFKYKAKKRYRRTHGHRSLLTELRVEAVLAAGDPLPKAAAAPAEEKKPTKTRTKAKAAVVAEAPEAIEAPESVEAPETLEVPEILETPAESPASAEETPATGNAAPADATKPAATKKAATRKPRTKKPASEETE